MLNGLLVEMDTIVQVDQKQVVLLEHMEMVRLQNLLKLVHVQHVKKDIIVLEEQQEVVVEMENIMI